MKAQLREILAHRQKRQITDSDRVPAAVLIPLYRKEGQYHMVFIKRTETVKEHKGQISFPGGNRDNRDNTLMDTALRESYEEIGLRTGDIEVIGELDDEITTTSNYIVTPFVAMIPWPYRFIINRDEVDELIEIPIAALLLSDYWKPAIETLDGGIVVDSFNFYYNGRLIWGATARILNKFMEIYRQSEMDEKPTGQT